MLPVNLLVDLPPLEGDAAAAAGVDDEPRRPADFRPPELPDGEDLAAGVEAETLLEPCTMWAPCFRNTLGCNNVAIANWESPKTYTLHTCSSSVQ